MGEPFLRNGIYYGRFFINGEEKWRSLRTSNPAQAKREYARLEREVNDQRIHGAKPKYTCASVMRLWLTSLEDQVKTGAMKDSARRRFETSVGQLQPHFGAKTLDEVNSATIQSYVDLRRKQGVKDATIRRDLSALSSMFRWAVKHLLIDRNPVREFDKKDIGEAEERVTWLEPAEWDRVIDCAPGYMKPLLIVLRETGLRWMEVALLEHDKHIKTVQLEIDGEMRTHVYIVIEAGRSKNRKLRAVPLTDRALEQITGAPRHPTSPYVFWRTKAGLPYGSIRKKWGQVRAAAGVPWCRLHDLRHDRGTWWLAEGVDLKTISRLLGHSSIKVTEKYARVMDPALFKAVASASAVASRMRAPAPAAPAGNVVQLPKQEITVARNHRALSDDQIVEARRLHGAGLATMSQLAIVYGVAKSTMKEILDGRVARPTGTD